MALAWIENPNKRCKYMPDGYAYMIYSFTSPLINFICNETRNLCFFLNKKEACIGNFIMLSVALYVSGSEIG